MGNLTFWQINAALDSNDGGSQYEAAVGELIALCWHRLSWTRYRACCALTTRIFVPFGLHFVEWNSFPGVFARYLKAHYPIDPVFFEARRAAVAEVLLTLIRTWRREYGQGDKYHADNAADACEAVGRLGIVEGEDELLQVVQLLARDNNQIRMSALLSLSALPPDRLPLLWASLKHEDGDPLRCTMASTAVLAYLRNSAAVPYLLDVAKVQTETDHYETVLRPTLLTLGNLGDIRALPLLNAIARNELHSERAVARKAIDRLMKGAEGHEEVTLVRASSLSTLHQESLLRPAHSKVNRHTNELLRPGQEDTKEA